MMPQLEIYVDGKGSVFRTAERGHLRICIASTSTDQSKAFREAQSTMATLTSTFRARATKTEDGRPHADAGITAFTITPLSSMSCYQRDQNWRELRDLPKEHTVKSSAEVVFRDMAQLADVSNELANMLHVSISETEWRLTDATRAEIEREARLKAIKDAVQKAQDYAGVVGRQVVAVEIKDQPSFGPGSVPQVYANHAQGQNQHMMQQAPSQHAAMPAITSGGPALEPKTITVWAHVSAKFVSKNEDSDRLSIL